MDFVILGVFSKSAPNTRDTYIIWQYLYSVLARIMFYINESYTR